MGRVLSRKIIWGGKLVLRAVLVAPGGGCGRRVCPRPAQSAEAEPFLITNKLKILYTKD